MERVILIKYGELTTKKGNRNFFVNLLYKSIQKIYRNDACGFQKAGDQKGYLRKFQFSRKCSMNCEKIRLEIRKVT